MYQVTRQLCEEAPGPSICVSRHQSYVGMGLKRVENRVVTSESDFVNEEYVRYSQDNGKTWSPWQDVYQEACRIRGDMELVWWSTPKSGVYNSVHNHYVAMNMQRLFLENHHASYKKYWEQASKTFTDHCFIWVSKDLEKWSWQQVQFEDGEDFSEDDWGCPGYVHVNDAFAGCNVEVLDNGDILFPVGGYLKSCCRILGLAVDDVFPSSPDIVNGLIVFRGRWNEAEGRYDLTPSQPVVINDLKSSRGVCEPTVIALKSGRIVVVFRGSNVMSESWRTRIQQGTPSYKWYTFSDDGGRTFTDPVPWHYDNAEVIYSPSSISFFFRCAKNGKAYWFGNITGPEAYGNEPRYPLVMGQVDGQAGFFKKQTFTAIEDRDPQLESDNLQISNFILLEDRQTSNIELYVTKLGANPQDMWRSDAYRYLIDVGSR